MKPYIPSYIPSIGEVDAFIKISRPDSKPEELGLNVLDEPTIFGIDRYILELELAETTKHKIDKFSIKVVENAQKNPLDINDWINKIADLRKRKLPTSVEYTKNMPQLEELMQEWPENFENATKDLILPDEKLNIPLDAYARIICNMLDIPIHKLNTDKSLIEALHLMFSLFSEFKNNQHFQRNITSKPESNNFQSMKF